jgi:hypothetical protein
MKKHKLDAFVPVRSKGKMIKAAPSDFLRPPQGASAIQPHAWHEVQPTSRPVDNSPFKFHKAARHQLAVITVVGSPFAGPAVRGNASLGAGAVSRSTKGGDPKCRGVSVSAALIGRFSGRVIRDVSHKPPAGFPSPRPLDFRRASDHRCPPAHAMWVPLAAPCRRGPYR